MQNIDFSKLEEIINFCRNTVPYYNKLLKDKTIRNFDNFERLPTLKNSEYILNTPPMNKFLLSKEYESYYVFSTGGTTSKPRFVLRNYEDFDDQYMDYIGLDVGQNDTVLNLFMAGIWGIFTSANITLMELGCKIIPYSGNNLNEEKYKNIVEIINDFEVNMLIGVPSTILALAIYMAKLKSSALNINKIFCLGEKMGETNLSYLKKVFPKARIKAKYGCMESAGIGFQCKYLEGNRYHVYPNQYVEILDNENKRLPLNHEGIITVTTLKKRLIPLLRYKTTDIGRIYYKECRCGIDHILEVKGREQEVLITASVHIRLDILEDILRKTLPEFTNFQVIVDNAQIIDTITVNIETKNYCSINKENIIKKIRQDLFNEIPDLYEAIESKKISGISINLVSPNSLEKIRNTGKLRRLIDLRK